MAGKMERSAVVVKAEARGQLYHAMVSPPVGRGVKERYAFLWRSPAQPTFSRLIEGSRPAWSPDGSEIFFAREGDIWKVAIDGGTPILLLKSDAGAAWPRWSPDGNQILFSRNNDGDTVILLLDGVKTRVRLIGVDTPETVHPRKPVEYYGREASMFVKNLLRGESVFVEYETGASRTDIRSHTGLPIRGLERRGRV